MKLRASRVMRELREGKNPTCLKVNLDDPRIVEIIGLVNCSSVWICNEHCCSDWFNLENQIRAAKLYDVDTIVRVEKGSYSDYVKPFECDATAIMVPHVASAEEARHIVDMTRFHPLGRRAMDGGNVDGVYCRISTEEYVRHTNSERFLVFQIESPEALEKVDEIAAVPGYDMLVFGPGDFSHRIGKPGQLNAPEVVAARKRVAAAARANGKYAFMPGLLDTREALVQEGWQVFCLGADVLGLGQYFSERMANFEKQAAPAAPQGQVYR